MLCHWINRDGIVADGSKLLSDCISAAVHTFDVGTNDYVCNDFVWRDHEISSFSIAVDSEHEPPAVAVEAPKKELRQRSDLDRLIEQARSELLFKKTSG